MAVREVLKHAENDASFPWLDHHPVALRPWPPLLVHPDRADRNRPVPERGLADDEPSLFLPDLSAQRFLPQIRQLQLVENASHLNADVRLFVVRVQTVSHRENANSVEPQFLQHGQHEKGVPGQPRKVIDQENIELMFLGRPEKGVQARPILPGTRRSNIRVDLGVIHDVAPRQGELSAGRNLVVDLSGLWFSEL